MHLMYTLDDEESDTDRKDYQVGTSWYAHLFIVPPSSKHVPLARFSPDDKFARHRVAIKKRFGILLTQLPATPM
ncbi:snoRNP complex protein [Ceratobasidium sp. 414]|nr:snoRNP complex protein [Ceratobasidium sp. 414]